MIKQLTVTNFILTDNIVIEFDEKLNILTGETGAGKSVIIGALDYILGRQVRSELTYDAGKPVFLEAVFNLSGEKDTVKIALIEELLGCSPLNEYGYLVVSREISGKRNSCRINGKRVNQAVITRLREILVDFHSQREQLKLFDDRHRLDVLDTWAGLLPLREQYQTLFEELKNLMERKKSLELMEKQAAEKMLLFEYQIEEIESMQLSIDEEKMLNSELDILTHAEELLGLCSEIEHAVIEEDNSVLDLISNFHQRFQKIGEGNETIKNIKTCFDELTNSINAVMSEVRTLKDGIDVDEEQLKQIENRISSILRIKNKYKMDVSQLLEYLQEMKTAIAEKSSRKHEIEELHTEIDNKTEELLVLSERLTSHRKQAGCQFSAGIKAGLSELAIPDGVFLVDISSLGKIYFANGIIGGLNDTGNDKVDFLFSANKGTEAQDIKEVVSGGELSRLQLVIKKMLAGRTANPTLILDEIDTGIGGKTANNIGKYISDISKYNQVICISHLPQIACFGEKHFQISKEIAAGSNEKESDRYDSHRPVITVKELTPMQREDEVARMLSGSKSEIAVKHAKELLEKHLRENK